MSTPMDHPCQKVNIVCYSLHFVVHQQIQMNSEMDVVTQTLTLDISTDIPKFWLFCQLTAACWSQFHLPLYIVNVSKTPEGWLPSSPKHNEVPTFLKLHHPPTQQTLKSRSECVQASLTHRGVHWATAHHSFRQHFLAKLSCQAENFLCMKRRGVSLSPSLESGGKSE